MHRWHRLACFLVLLAASVILGGCCDDCDDCGDPLAPGIDDGLSGVVTGPLHVGTQAELAELAAVTEVRTSLILQGVPGSEDPIRDLAPLRRLQKVQDLRIFQTQLRDLSGLDSLHTIENELYLSSNDSLRSLAGMPRAQSIRAVRISNQRRLVSLDGLEGGVGLQSLDIEACFALRSIDGLGDLSDLSRLQVQYCEDLEALRLPDPLPVLADLQLRDLPELTTLELGGGELPLLASVIVENLAGITAPVFLADLPSLRNLALRELPGLADLSCLGNLPALATLQLLDLPDLTSLAGLSGGAELTSLQLGDLPLLSTTEGLPELGQLRSLQVYACDALQAIPIQHPGDTPVTLQIYDCPAFSSLADAPLVAAATALRLDGCGLVDLSGMPVAWSLGEITLSRCASLSSLTGLGAAPHLEGLILRECSSLADLGDGPVLERLRVLEIAACDGLESLAGLAGAPYLEELIIDDCDGLLSLSGPELPYAPERIAISDCALLSSLAGLEDVHEIRQWLAIQRNRDLASLAGLTQLERVEDLTILDNVQLGNDAVFAFLQGVDVTGQVTVGGNGF